MALDEDSREPEVSDAPSSPDQSLLDLNLGRCTYAQLAEMLQGSSLAALQFPDVPFAKLALLTRVISALGTATFHRTDNGFVNANGDGIWIQEERRRKCLESKRNNAESHSFACVGNNESTTHECCY